MTREDIKTITDIVHKTIYGFFDVCGDDEETPMTDKDKLLLKINKAICTNIKALKQQPCGDVATFKEDVLDVISRIGLQKSDTKEVQAVAECLRAVEALSPDTPRPKMGRWISSGVQGEIDGQSVRAFTCSECGAISIFRMASVNIVNGDLCPNCGAKMQEVEE